MEMPQELTLSINHCSFFIKKGDITLETAEAIANAANSSLLGGGGVDGAIHRAGGKAILEQCQRAVRENGPCKTGQAVITTAGKLPAKYVLHTVGPVWQGGNHNEETLLANCYRNCLSLAKQHGIQSVTFPSISTGVYGYPIDQAATIAIETIFSILEKENHFSRVGMILFDSATYHEYRNVVERMT